MVCNLDKFSITARLYIYNNHPPAADTTCMSKSADEGGCCLQIAAYR